MLVKKTICSLIFLMFSFCFAQVELTFQNKSDTGIDVYLKNPAGCSFCSDSTYDNKAGCEQFGFQSDATKTGVWSFDASIAFADCEGTCSDGVSPQSICSEKGTCADSSGTDLTTYKNNKNLCEATGYCSEGLSTDVYANADSCAAGTIPTDYPNAGQSGVWTTKVPGVWTAATWTDAAKNGTYFDGYIGGYQFELSGVDVTGVNSSSTPTGFIVQTSGVSDSTVSQVLGFSLTAATIAPSTTSQLLASINYTVDTDTTTKGVCFEVTTSSGNSVISDKFNQPVNTKWGDCACDVGVVDACGDCEGNNPTNCYATDSDNVCTADNECEADACDCSGTCGGAAVVDNCNTCDAISSNDCTKDCADVWGGSSINDCTGSCVEMSAAAADEDSDGYCDEVDACPGSPANATVNGQGCTTTQLSISQLGDAIPSSFAIAQNFPNPFNPTTNIAFDVAHMDNISLVIYDLTGKEVVTLASGAYAPGSYNVEWNAIDNNGNAIVSGMYIYRYITSTKAITRKMLYLK
jgi:hypothetical protein